MSEKRWIQINRMNLLQNREANHFACLLIYSGYHRCLFAMARVRYFSTSLPFVVSCGASAKGCGKKGTKKLSVK